MNRASSIASGRVQFHIVYLAMITALSCWMPWATARPLDGTTPGEPTSLLDFVFRDGASVQLDGWHYDFSLGSVGVFGWWIGIAGPVVAVLGLLVQRLIPRVGVDVVLGFAIVGVVLALGALALILSSGPEANSTVSAAGFSRSIGPGPFVAALGMSGILVAAWWPRAVQPQLVEGPT
jgi:hypothetical protein